MRSMKLAVAIALVASTSAFGAFAESEPNNTAATADPIVLPSCLSADVGLAALAAGGGDVDYYSLTIPSGCTLTGITTSMIPLPAQVDTVLSLIAPDAVTVIVASDDAGNDQAGGGPNIGGNSLGSAIRFYNGAATNLYYLRVAGFGATDAGPYALTVSLAPEPSTLALLGIGAVALIRRRK